MQETQTTQQSLIKMGKKKWNEKIIYTLYIVSALIILVTIERMVIDIFGAMWFTMIINALTGISSMLCILGLYYRKKTAVIVYILLAFITLGINIIIMLMYNNVGLLKGTEKYLSIPMRGKSWWNNHGFFCYQVCGGGSLSQNNNNKNNNNNNDNYMEGSGDTLLLTDGTLLSAEEDSTTIYGSGEQVSTQACFITYAVIETTHSAANAFLILLTVFFAMLMLCTVKKAEEKELESLRCMNVGRYGGEAIRDHEPHTGRRHQSYYKLSDSFDTIGTVRGASSSSSSM